MGRLRRDHFRQGVHGPAGRQDPQREFTFRQPTLASSFMLNLTTLHADEMRACHEDIRRRYQAFAERKLKLDLGRGKAATGAAVCLLPAATEKLLQSHAS